MSRSLTWIVRDGDGTIVDAIVARAGGDDHALSEGRVFIGRRRARRGDAVAVGDEVIVHARTVTDLEVTILHHAKGILAVNKPAGISTIPDQRDAEGSLLYRAARAVNVDPVSLHPTSRLDRGVSGIVVFAESSRARERLGSARDAGRYHRLYVAIATKAPVPPKGEWNAPIGRRARDPKKRMVGGHDARPALTRYRTVASTPHASLLAVEPITGRTHQIRVHVGHAGAALLGDRDYGGARTLVLPSGKVIAFDRIGLHCARVMIDDGGELDLDAPVPAELRRWWRDAEGADAAWSLAVSSEPP